MAACSQRVYDVGILMYPGVDLLDFAGPHGVLSHVSYNNNPVSPDHVFNLRLIAAQEDITASDPVTVKRHISIHEAHEDLDSFDVLIVPGGPLPVMQSIIDGNGPEYRFIKSYINDSKNDTRVLMSVCSAAFILASTGILAGKTATTHSLALEALKDICQEATRKFGGNPTKVMKARYVDAGLTKSGMRIITSGGISCGFDASLYLASLKTSESASNFAAMVLEYIQPCQYLSGPGTGRCPVIMDSGMDESLESGDAFAIPDLWQKSSLAQLNARESWADIDGLSPFHNVLFVSQNPVTLPSLSPSSDDPLQTTKGTGSKADDPALFTYGPLEEFEVPDSSATSSDHEEQGEFDKVLEDLWSAKEVLQPSVARLELKNWERFSDRTFKEPRSLCISEAGPRVFDAWLSYKTATQPPAPALQYDAVLSSLVQLALGRESLLYRYEEKNGKFAPVIEDIRISGYSRHSFNSLTKEIISYGSHIRQARGIADSLQDSRRAAACSVALGSGVNIILSALQAHLGDSLASVRTVLQLQDLVQQPRLLLSCLAPMVSEATKLWDSESVSMVFSLVQDMEVSVPRFQPIMNHLLAHVAHPWLKSLELSLGLGAESFLSAVSEPDREDKEKRLQRIPRFITSSIVKTVLETDQSLKLLQTHDPEHPMARPSTLSLFEPPSLRWLFTWHDIDRTQAQAQRYEGAALKALKEYHLHGTFTLPQRLDNEERPMSSSHDLIVQTTFPDLLSQVEGPLDTILMPGPSALATTVSQTLSNGVSVDEALAHPPISLTPELSISGLLTAQSRLLAHSTLHLLFHTHGLRSHLRLLHAYLLLSNGPFLVRLSHALFDPSLPSAAFQKGRIRAAGREGGVGLQLGSREVWPPASSELRIVLMGILTESYHSSFPDRLNKLSGGTVASELPGDLSFAIRGDMSDAELDKCINPDGLEALDFLKVGYRAPKPLGTVITTDVLDRYERISRLLLRGARLCWVVRSLLTDHSHNILRQRRRNKGTVQRFEIKSHHFVTTIFSYFSDSINEIWMAFEHRLDAIEAQLDNYEVGRKLDGISGVRTLHEEVLDRILAACLLRRRQAKVMGLLEEILGLVLKFAGMLRRAGEGKEVEDDKAVEELYALFKRKSRVFLTVIRGLQEQKSLVGGEKMLGTGRAGAGEEMGNGIGRLVLLLDWGH
ncbi:MAG: hypothetical protein Q9212_004750 [Teloschistes hypoglaucus]